MIKVGDKVYIDGYATIERLRGQIGTVVEVRELSCSIRMDNPELTPARLGVRNFTDDCWHPQNDDVVILTKLHKAMQ